MRTHRIFGVVLGAVSLVAAACGGAAPATPSPSGSASPGIRTEVKVGVAISLTGAANVYGPSQQNGVSLAMEEINGMGLPFTVRLIIEDDASTAAQSITVFKKFIEQDKVGAILGPTLSGSAAGAHPVAQQGQMPTIAISNTGIGIVGKCDYGPCDYIFRASLGEETALPETVKAAKAALNLKNVVLLYAQDDKFSADDGTIFEKALTAQGIQIAKKIAFSKNDVDFAGPVSQAKAENPDALVVGALAGPATKILQEIGKQMAGKKMLCGNGCNSAAIIAGAGAAAEATIVGTAWDPASPAAELFVKNYKAKYGKDPDQFAAQAYSAMLVLTDALKRTSNPNDHAALKKSLEGVQALKTPLGGFSFNADHDVTQPVYVMTVKGNAFVPFK
jgi:branched-chain amino acid transport system substrate-binding protein